MNETNQPMGEAAEQIDPAANAASGAAEAVAAAEARAQESRNNYLRAVAEMENFRKRADREIENARKFAIERFAQELVPVSDALEAGIEAGTAKPGGQAMLEGAQATLRELHRAFERRASRSSIRPDSPSIRLA